VGRVSSLRILIVDDVVVQRKMLGRLLATAGYAVEISSNGEDALEKVLTGDFDILITDRDMPGLDGTALCRRVRESDLANGYVFIIMLTGRDTVNDLVSGLEAGADMYVAKSSDPSELLACLKTGTRILNLERALRRAKATDGLLDVYRRDYLEMQLPREIERARRYGFSLGLLMADLDWFKRINDDHGHAAGDQTLREFCIRTGGCLRHSDWIARYGGEEFVVVLPHADLGAARQVAEKIRSECASRPIVACGASLGVTVSLGVAGLGSEEEARVAAAALLQRADAALYRSKRDGRNRVSVAGLETQ
jgi:diguanylate cyclase (GGDEF)-like protein